MYCQFDFIKAQANIQAYLARDVQKMASAFEMQMTLKIYFVFRIGFSSFLQLTSLVEIIQTNLSQSR